MRPGLGAVLLVAFGLIVIGAWLEAMPVMTIMAGSTRFRVQLDLAVAIPLGLAAGCLWIGGVRGMRAVHPLRPLDRWIGRAFFGAGMLIGIVAMVVCAVFLGSE